MGKAKNRCKRSARKPKTSGEEDKTDQGKENPGEESKQQPKKAKWTTEEILRWQNTMKVAAEEDMKKMGVTPSATQVQEIDEDMKEALRILKETAYLSDSDGNESNDEQHVEVELVDLTEEADESPVVHAGEREVIMLDPRDIDDDFDIYNAENVCEDPLAMKSEDIEAMEQEGDACAFEETDPLNIKSEGDEVIEQKEGDPAFQEEDNETIKCEEIDLMEEEEQASALAGENRVTIKSEEGEMEQEKEAPSFENDDETIKCEEIDLMEEEEQASALAVENRLTIKSEEGGMEQKEVPAFETQDDETIKSEEIDLMEEEKQASALQNENLYWCPHCYWGADSLPELDQHMTEAHKKANNLNDMSSGDEYMPLEQLAAYSDQTVLHNQDSIHHGSAKCASTADSNATDINPVPTYSQTSTSTAVWDATATSATYVASGSYSSFAVKEDPTLVACTSKTSLLDTASMFAAPIYSNDVITMDGVNDAVAEMLELSSGKSGDSLSQNIKNDPTSQAVSMGASPDEQSEESSSGTKCSLCLKYFSSESALMSHSCVTQDAIITPQLCFQCRLCGERFSSWSDLQMHAKCHMIGASGRVATRVPGGATERINAMAYTSAAQGNANEPTSAIAHPDTTVHPDATVCDNAMLQSAAEMYANATEHSQGTVSSGVKVTRCSWCGMTCADGPGMHFFTAKECLRKSAQVRLWLNNTQECIACKVRLYGIKAHRMHYAIHRLCERRWLQLMHTIICRGQCWLCQQKKEAGVKGDVSICDASGDAYGAGMPVASDTSVVASTSSVVRMTLGASAVIPVGMSKAVGTTISGQTPLRTGTLITSTAPSSAVATTDTASSGMMTLGALSTNSAATGSSATATAPRTGVVFFPCVQCRVVFHSAETRSCHFMASPLCFETHLRLSVSAVACIFCAHLFSDLHSFLIHLKNSYTCQKSPPAVVLCPSCHQAFTPASCEEHILMTLCAKSYPCVGCNAVFQSIIGRHLHLADNRKCRIKHIMAASMMYMCKLCRLKFLNLIYLQQHECPGVRPLQPAFNSVTPSSTVANSVTGAGLNTCATYSNSAANLIAPGVSNTAVTNSETAAAISEADTPGSLNTAATITSSNTTTGTSHKRPCSSRAAVISSGTPLVSTTSTASWARAPTSSAASLNMPRATASAIYDPFTASRTISHVNHPLPTDVSGPYAPPTTRLSW